MNDATGLFYNDSQNHTTLSFGEDYHDIRKAVRAICKKYPGAYWRDLEERNAYGIEFVQELTDAGFLSALIPEEYGGSGLPIRAGCVIFEEINAAGCSSGDCRAQMYMMGFMLRHGSPEQKARLLPDIASGKLRYQAFGVTEPTSGSDTSQLRTRAVRVGDHYIVNGQKIWTSRAMHSDLMTLLVRTTPVEEVKRRTDGLSVLLIDMKESINNGMTIKPIKTMLNHDTNEVFFDNLKVPVENLIGQEGNGFRHILDGMNAERILVSSESLGDARYFIKKAVAHSKERVVFGRPIGQNQGVQFPIARAYAEWAAADMVHRTAAAIYDAQKPCGREANLAKLLTSEAAWNAGEACMQVHGGFSMSREYDIERKWRSARLQRIAPVSTNLILAYISHSVLGLPKSY